MDVCPENRTQMTQKKLIFADIKDKIRMICENLRMTKGMGEARRPPRIASVGAKALFD